MANSDEQYPASSSPRPGLKSRVYSGVAWSVISRAIQIGLQFGLQVILFRLLSPDDFGLLAMIVVFTGFAALFGEIGFSTALIQRKEIDEEQISSVFWLNMAVGTALSIIMFLLAPLIATYYKESELTGLVRVMSAGFIMNSIGNVPLALLQRRMQFKALAKIGMLSQFGSGAVTVFLAFRGWGIWSLVVQSLLGTSVNAVLSWVLSAWRPRFRFSLRALQQLWSFTVNLFGFSILNYWIRNADNLLVGKLMGKVSLGVYSRAYNLMLLPISQITGVISNVIFPTLSGIQDDKVRVKRIYLRSLSVIALIAFPIMTGMMVTARPFVLTLFGGKWAGIIPLIQILALVGGMQALLNPTGWIYMSQGRTDVMLRWNAFFSVILVGGIGIGVYLGTVKSVAICYALANLVEIYPGLRIPGKLINMTVADTLRAVQGPLFVSAGMGVSVFGLALVLPAGWPNWLQLVVLTTVGAAIYSSLVFGLRLQALDEVFQFGREMRSGLPLAKPVEQAL